MDKKERYQRMLKVIEWEIDRQEKTIDDPDRGPAYVSIELYLNLVDIYLRLEEKLDVS